MRNVSPNAKATLDDITLRLEYQRELVGTGRVVAADIRGETPINFEVQVAPRILNYITATLASTATVVQLDATFSGKASYWLDPLVSSSGQTRMVNDPEPGTWTPFRVSQGSPYRLQVPRSAWYEQVLAPTRNEQYLYLEVALRDRASTIRA